MRSWHRTTHPADPPRPPRLAGTVLACALLGLPSFTGPDALSAQNAPTATELVETALEKRLARWEGVDDYTVYGTFHGNESIHYYEKVVVDGRPAFRIVPPNEYEGRELEEAGLADGFPAGAGETRSTDSQGSGALPGMDALPVPEGVGDVAGRAGGVADRLSGAADDVRGRDGDGDGLLGKLGGAAAGAARGELQQRLMRRGMEGLLGGLQDDGTDDAESDARIEAMMFEVLAREARLAGEETVDGRRAWVLVADDLGDVDLAGPAGEQTDIRLRSAKIWLDAEEYVSLRTEMEMAAGEGAPPMTIEVVDRDYRHVDGLYEPFERTVRSAGMMQSFAQGDPEVQEKLQEAMEQFERLDEKLADMAPAQRQMFEQQIEVARQRIEGLAGGEVDATTIEMRTEEIVVNQGPPSRYGRGAIEVSVGIEADVPRTIATLAEGPHPGGDGSLSMLQLIGNAEDGPTAMLQLNVAGGLPETGAVEGRGALLLRWADGREAAFESDAAGTTITVTSRTSRRIRGEYEVEAQGHVSESGAAPPTPKSVTIRGSFEAARPRAAPAAPAGTSLGPVGAGGAP